MWEKDIQLEELNTENSASYEELFKSVFRALGKDYVNICLIDRKSRMVTTLKGGIHGHARRSLDELECCSYEEICQRSILSHVPKKNQESLFEKVDYEKVMEILSYKPEYSFTYECIIEDKKHLCQMKYMRMDDERHVLMGFRMVDDIVANEREHRKSLAKAVAVAEQSYAAAENANNCRGAS